MVIKPFLHQNSYLNQKRAKRTTDTEELKKSATSYMCETNKRREYTQYLCNNKLNVLLTLKGYTHNTLYDTMLHRPRKKLLGSSI
jgi:hypothetical protein